MQCKNCFTCCACIDQAEQKCSAQAKKCCSRIESRPPPAAVSDHSGNTSDTHMQGRVVNYTGSETRSDTRRHVAGPVIGLSADESRQRHLEDSKQAKHTLGCSCCM